VNYEVIEMKHVEIETGESVYVTHAEDPTDFRVCTLLLIWWLYYGIVFWCNIRFRDGVWNTIDKSKNSSVI